MTTTWANGDTDNRTGSSFEQSVAPDEFSLPSPSGSDDSTEIQSLIDLAAVSGGEVVLGAGTYLAAGLLMKSNVTLRGKGPAATVLKLKDSGNTDLITNENFATLAAGVTQAGITKWSIRDLTLDGNKANNSSGWPLRVYGYAYSIDNVEIKNGKSGGVWSQWGDGGQDMEAHWNSFRIRDCSGNGLDWHGPHDSLFINGVISKCDGKGIYTVEPATSEQFTNIHVWGTELTHGMHFRSPAYCVNCQVEGATVANLIPDCNFGSFIGGAVFGTGSGAEVGIQFGLDATARYWDIRGVRVFNFGASGKPLNYVTTSANNVQINFDSFSGATKVVYGTPSTRDSVQAWNGADPSIVTEDPTSNGGIFMGQQRILNDDGTRGITFGSSASTIFIDIRESTAVGNSSNAGGRIAVIDNGSGKSQLVVRFASGATQILATEP